MKKQHHMYLTDNEKEAIVDTHGSLPLAIKLLIPPAHERQLAEYERLIKELKKVQKSI